MSNLPKLISDIHITPFTLPSGDQEMLDTERATLVADLQSQVATITKQLQLIATVDNATLNATEVPRLEAAIENAKARLIEALNTYGAKPNV
jgi:hypothetical protein